MRKLLTENLKEKTVLQNFTNTLEYEALSSLRENQELQNSIK